MSSLLQFNGTCSRRGVDLQFVKVRTEKRWIGSPDLAGSFQMDHKVDADTFVAPDGKTYSHIYIATRKPCGMLGCWVLFRYNGETHAPDLSVPTSVEKMPRDAKRLSAEESLKIWLS